MEPHDCRTGMQRPLFFNLTELHSECRSSDLKDYTRGKRINRVCANFVLTTTENGKEHAGQKSLICCRVAAAPSCHHEICELNAGVAEDILLRMQSCQLSKVGSLIVRGWGMQCGSWKRSRCAYGEKALWTGQVIWLAQLFGTIEKSSRVPSTQIYAASSCARNARSNVHDLSSAARDNWQQRYPLSLDFRSTDVGRVKWLDNSHQPAWVDEQLTTLDVKMNCTAPGVFSWSLLSDHGDNLKGLGFQNLVTPECVKKLCQQGQVKEAVEILGVLVGMNSSINRHTFYTVLKGCVAKKDLVLGGQVHVFAVKMGFGSDTFLCNHFIRMFAGHGKLKEAMDVFQRVPLPDTFMWSSVISAHVKQGQAQRAMTLYQRMRDTRTEPDGYVLVAALQACAAARDIQFGKQGMLEWRACANLGVSALEKGKQLHSQLVDRGFESDVAVGGSLVNMYVKCGDLQDARTVFDGLGQKSVVTWNAMIAGYARKEGMGQEALALYSVMQNESMVVPNAVTFVCLLQACANLGVSAFETGSQLHSQLRNRGLEFDVVVSSSLVNMYVKCGSLVDARLVFDGLSEKKLETWTAMITGYAHQKGMGQEALGLYSAMLNEVLAPPDAVTFACLLQACANVGVSALEEGKQLHSQLKERRLVSDVVVGGSLVNMYTKCGALEEARVVFDALTEKNVVTWNAMIAGYSRAEGMGQEALNLYSAMQNEGLTAPDKVTFVCLLQACANMGVSALERGKQLHSQLKDRELEIDLVVGGSLVNMYAKCGSLMDARYVFDILSEKNVVTWTAMIAGYAQQEGMGQEALNLYPAMHRDGMTVPNAVTFVCLLQACANVGVSALEMGKELHSQVKDRRLEADVGGSLVNMYAKCGSLKDARRVFDGMKEKDVVTWTTMIAGYSKQEGMGQEALDTYNNMRNEGKATPDAVTYMCLLEACASVGALQQGKQLHSKICEGGLESNVLLGTCLVKMYAKCGFLELAREVFDRLPMKDLVSWNALLKGYAEHGEGGMAIQCFEQLLHQRIQPDEVTFCCLFKACSHARLVEQGQQYFKSMVEQHGVQPDDQIYCCMVDLLGRSGHLDRAEKMLQASGLAGDAVCWTALLSACKSYGDVETGRSCFNHLVKLEPTVSTAYVLLSSIYANAGRWDEVDTVESLRKAAGAKKMAAKACIEVKKEVHVFTVGEERSDVAATLRKMNLRVKEGGHVPQTQLVLRAVSEQEKEDALCGHAEKLALAFGLLNTPAGSTLVVTKNLRMCDDCHSSTKIMSKLEKRGIVVRDGHRVHRFQNGACSCQDRS